jgi:hypothetical protein
VALTTLVLPTVAFLRNVIPVIDNELLCSAVSVYGFLVTGEGMCEAAKGTASFQI